MFRSLHQRDFRLLWLTIGLGNFGNWMETLVIAWVVLERTDSALLLGLVAAARFSGSLLGPLGGLVADRFDRRRVLVLLQAVHLAQAGVLLGLLLMDRASPGAIIGLVWARGIIQGLDYPARQSLIRDLVGRESVTNAIALNRVALDATTILGPLLGGAFTELFSPATGYALAFSLYVASFVPLVMIRSRPTSVREGARWRNLVAGLGYARVNQAVGLLLVLALLANLLGYPFMYSLLPVYARRVLGVGPVGLGVLMASAGLGSVLGSLVMALSSKEGRNGRLLMAGFLSWASLITLFALSRWFGLSVALLLLAWAGQALGINMVNSLLLTVSKPEMLGRVMGVRAMTIGLQPVGNLMLGAGADALGAAPALIISSLGLLLSVLTLGLVRPQLWKGVRGEAAPGPAAPVAGQPRP